MKIPLLFVVTLAGSFQAAGLTSVGESKSAAVKPNVIFILTDDLGWGDVGVFFQNHRQAAKVRSQP